MKKTKNLILIALFLLLVSCEVEQQTSEQIPEEYGDPIQVYFCPKDDCEQAFLELTQSTIDLDCAFFDLDLEKIIQRLSDKDARLVTDEKVFHEELEILNPVIDTSSRFTHNKFCIIDKKIVWTGSMNPTINGATKNNNNVVIIHSPTLAQNYQDEFEELYRRQFGKGNPVNHSQIRYNNKLIENYFCPEDNCKEHILEKLNESQESIVAMTFSFTDQDIGNVLIEKASNGLNIKVLFEKSRYTQQYNLYKVLEPTKVETFLDTNGAIMHHKVFIIDGSIVITGSMNPTGAGNEKNDENILIIHDEAVAQKFLEEFERLTQTI